MAVIIAGPTRMYENFQAGAATDPSEGTDDLMLTFSDNDNETTHMFRMAKSSAQQYINLLQQTLNKQKIEVVGADALKDLKGPHR